MFKSVLRTATAPSLGRAIPKAQAARRFISTAPPHQTSRSWKSSATRWGLAGALVYYYNTASTFAEEPAYAVHAPPETEHERETYPTVEAISEQRRNQKQSQPSSQSHESTVAVPDGEQTAAGSPEQLEEEASQQGAFNEETGEINWDCPCLGGMAYGPCGDQFRAAFSCFVFSNADPKGVDCIEHFKAMQNCFREHPDIYGAELEDDDAPPQEGEEQGAVMARDSSGSAEAEGGDDQTAHTARHEEDSQAAVEAKKPADDGPAKSAEGKGSRASQSEASGQQAIDSTPSPQTAQQQKAAPADAVEVDHHVEAHKAEAQVQPKSWHDAR